MHDPSTVAWEIKSPFKRKSALGGYRPPILVMWHEDPEKDGSDDSCDWFGSKRKLNAKERALLEAIGRLETILYNRPFYPDHEAYHRFKAVKSAVWPWLKRSRWRWHPRWHFWHYRIQIPALQDLKRWLWGKCCTCGKGFAYGYCPGSNSWHGTGPQWFRSEKGIFHSECDTSMKSPAMPPRQEGDK